MKRAFVLLMACFASIVMSAQQLHWTPVDEGLYSGSTGIIAVVQIDGVEQTSTQMELAAFCGDECRGTAFTSEFPITHRYLAMLNVYGENGNELTFKAYDHSTNQELVDMNPVVTVVFSEDGSGTLFEPLELNFVQEVVDENITFADANVKALCVANWDTNGDGELSYTEAAAVMDLGTVFKENNSITSFDELQYFTGLAAIGERTFYNCKGLNSVVLPNSATAISREAFCGCNNLEFVELPNSLITIGNSAFEYCYSIETIVLPNTVTTIDGYAFYYCSRLISMEIPMSVTSIGKSVFSSCSSLEQIVVDAGNTYYDSRNGCNAIIETATNKLVSGCKNTIIPDGVTAIGESAFFAHSGLLSITLPNSIVYIEKNAFGICTGLESILLPNSITTIGENAFSNCRGLTSLVIPNSITSIATGAFDSCRNLESISVETNNSSYDSRNNCNAIIETNSNTLIVGCKNTLIPNSVTAIGAHAFYGQDIVSLYIPNSVTSIGNSAFVYSTINSITIPNSVTTIGRGAFQSCSSLASVVIPDMVSIIEEYTFNWCSSLASVTIGVSVSSIKNNAFSNSGLSALTVLAETPPAIIGSNVFGDVGMDIQVYVPCGTTTTYQTASGWSEFANYQELECPSYEITTTANPTNGGTITGSGTYTQGATCTLIATPVTGYSFVNWTEGGQAVSTDATYSFEVTAARNLVANFALQGPITNHWIPIQNFENTMDGIGIILIDGVEQQSAALELGIFCGEECRGSVLPEEEDGHWLYYFSMGGVTNETFSFRLYDHASQQELELTCFNEVPFEINAFLGDWDEPYEFQFSNNVLVTVSVNPEGAGEVTGAGEYPHGTTATLSATANTGFAFRDWSINGETVSTEPTLTLTVEAPILVTANFDYVQEYSLSTGWNWWSSYIELSDIDGLTMLEEGLGESGVMIKTNGSYARRRPNNTWFGSLNSINNETGYKIQTSSNCTVVVRGTLADPSDHPIAINASGWTWIGYPVQASQSANAALSCFNPENKDIIKGQNGYARYDANSGTWKPSSFTLTPGKSYLYYSNATEAKSLVWNAGRSTFSDPEHHWTPNQTFENTMDGIGIVVIDGEEQFTGDLELGIFCGDDCRGSVFAEDEGDHWFYYFSMGGVSGETFTFRLYNHATQEELDLVCNNEAVPFEINGFLGDWDAPYEIGFTSNSPQTFTLPITGYGNSAGGYYLIAPPFDDINPADIEGMTEGDYDLYRFDQSQAGEEWRNYEAEPFNLTLGKGYLYAHKTDVTLSFTGEPYSGDGVVTLSKTVGFPFTGWNLVGNPFAQAATIDRDFYVMNTAGTEIIASSTNSINPMQGIFVIAAEDGETMTFVPESSTDQDAKIVLSVSKDRASVFDRAVVRLGGNSTLPKFMINPDNTKIYIPIEGTDYAVVASDIDNVMPVCFKAREDGSYTLSADIVNLDLEYLHLVDNMTGTDVDLLQTPSYTFEAHSTDYAERFRLEFQSNSVCEDTDGDNAPFAFVKGGNIVIVGVETDATLQMMDATGRVIVSRSGRIQSVATDGIAPGVYMLRLINGDDVRVQKIVIR